MRRAGRCRAPRRPSPRLCQPSALARESTRLVGLGAQHRVDDERLEPGVPGAADLGGAGVDLGGGEGDLAGVAGDRARAPRRRPRRRAIASTLRLDHLDREPHQVDGLLQRDHAGQGPRRGAEDRGGQRGAAAVVAVVGAVAEPVDEARGCRPARSARPRTGPRRSGSRNQGRSSAIRAVAAVLRPPIERVAAPRRGSRARVATCPQRLVIAVRSATIHCSGRVWTLRDSRTSVAGDPSCW